MHEVSRLASTAILSRRGEEVRLFGEESGSEYSRGWISWLRRECVASEINRKAWFHFYLNLRRI